MVGRLDGILKFPAVAIGIELEHAWGGLSECAFRSIECPEELLKVEHISLPEFRHQFLSHTFVDCKCKTFNIPRISKFVTAETSHPDTAVTTVEKSSFKKPRAARLAIELPSRGRQEASVASKTQLAQCYRIFDRSTASFSFTWQRSAPKYESGFSTFSREEYATPPSCSYAEIFYQDDRSIPGPRRVMMTINNKLYNNDSPTTEEPLLLDEIKHFLRTRKADDPELWPFMLLLQSAPQSMGYSLLPIFIILEIIVRDTATFLKEASDEIHHLSFLSRHSPSANIVNYLSHLDSCRESALMGLSHAYGIARDLAAVVKQKGKTRNQGNTATTIEEEFLKEKREDMKFLIEQLEEHLREKIRSESVLMKERRMLLQCRQVSTLTWIVIVWVPVSLLIGIFSMNVTSPSHIFGHNNPGSTPILATAQSILPASSFSPLPATTVVARQVTTTTPSSVETTTSLVPAQTPANTTPTNTTKALPESAGGHPSQPYHFSFALFLFLLPILPILATFLNLTLPSILRLASQSTSSLRTSPAFTPLLFLLYYLLTYWLIPSTLSHESSQNTNLKISSLPHAGHNPISTPSFILSLFTTSLIFLTNLTTSIIYHQNRLKIFIWLFFGCLLLVSYCVDYFSDWEKGVSPSIATGLGLSGVVPVLFLVGVWGVPRICGVLDGWSGRRRVDKRERERLGG
ncbi:hypothetical protein HYFRA_00000064 [Hymenoscyphus fraxineus]|uniref:Uncharacterized protein n=1 Tax=Hymenoscyphus fraxineus TaxID=746836 RepID=A0A9N9PWF6_9HELO|nr:hypothetical protein HYFRA_00000064 [Hymenoscyphus fraxineus]